MESTSKANWVAGMSCIGGIATGVVALVMGMDEGKITGAAYMAAAALAFGLTAIAVLRK
ncbi:MAG: hypothetical protein JW720_10685 [Sedimentisphaerales bacterium]|nr:hypothetical protein [Sedimentisphaerales bacterium]